MPTTPVLQQTTGCACHGATFCPDLVFVGYDDDVPIFEKRDQQALRANWSGAESVPAGVLDAPTVTDAAVEAAMDAFYPGEDWRATFSEPAPKWPNGTLHVHIADMRAAIEAALAVIAATDRSAV